VEQQQHPSHAGPGPAGSGPPLRLGLIGCGAVSEKYHAPSIVQCAKMGLVMPVHLVDPAPARIAALRKTLTAATPVASVEDLAGKVDVAIVASPVRFHAEQVKSLVAAGVHVLCEKPVARSAAEAREMIAAADAARRVLAVGLFRRFFPAVDFVAQLVRAGTFGRPLKFKLDEGGRFGWPAVTPSFFDPAQSGGGATLDIGVHLLDIVMHWFGAPESFDYADDAYGGIETNAWATLRYPGGLEGTIRLSWDVPLSGVYAIDFERGWVRWKTNGAHLVTFGFDDVTWASHAHLAHARKDVPTGLGTEGPRYLGAFTAQLADFVEAVRTGRPPRVDAPSAVGSLDLIERMYASRRTVVPPHFTPAERERALAMARGGAA